MHSRLPLAIAACLLVAACGQSGQMPQDQNTAAPSSSVRPGTQPAPATTTSHTSTPAADMKRFQNVRLGFYIDYPSGMASSVRFDSQYLANDQWKTYADTDSSGTAVLMLTLPGSNDVTAGELRIGISSDKKEIRRCDQPPSAAQPSTRDTAAINGTTFTTWHAHDAGMSHYLKVHSYRVVHGGYCYAIDLLVTGTNPKVYDPPRKPPFSQEEAFASLHKALWGFQFTR